MSVVADTFWISLIIQSIMNHHYFTKLLSISNSFSSSRSWYLLIFYTYLILKVSEPLWNWKDNLHKQYFNNFLFIISYLFHDLLYIWSVIFSYYIHFDTAKSSTDVFSNYTLSIIDEYFFDTTTMIFLPIHHHIIFFSRQIIHIQSERMWEKYHIKSSRLLFLYNYALFFHHAQCIRRT